jgi:hypothetical protein
LGISPRRYKIKRATVQAAQPGTQQAVQAPGAGILSANHNQSDRGPKASNERRPIPRCHASSQCNRLRKPTSSSIGLQTTLAFTDQNPHQTAPIHFPVSSPLSPLVSTADTGSHSARLRDSPPELQNVQSTPNASEDEKRITCTPQPAHQTPPEIQQAYQAHLTHEQAPPSPSFRNMKDLGAMHASAWLGNTTRCSTATQTLTGGLFLNQSLVMLWIQVNSVLGQALLWPQVRRFLE